MKSRLVAAAISVVAVTGRVGGRPVGSFVGAMLSCAAAVMPARTLSIASVATQGTLLLATSDARPAAGALASRISRSRRLDLAVAAHGLLLRLGDVDRADNTSSRLEDQVAPATLRHLRALEAKARGGTHDAVNALGSAMEDDAPMRALRLDLLRSLGRASAVLDCADPTLVGSAIASRYRFDALWDLGQVEDAIAAIDEALCTSGASTPSAALATVTTSLTGETRQR